MMEKKESGPSMYYSTQQGAHTAVSVAAQPGTIGEAIT